jgi:2-methylisocitrate lyase-like PEP mutase family enzyme
MKDPGSALKKLLARPKMLVMPGAFDAFSAKLIEQAGYEAVYMTGYGVSATLGKPDVGLATMTEMLERAALIANSVNIPLLADADTGYGGVINVIRTIQEYERAGVAGCHIEDQVFPKKCGSMKGKELIPAEEMVGKIKAAVDTRRDKNFVIVARTDATAGYGLDEAIRRGRLYAQAGADAVMIMAPGPPDDMARFNRAMSVPTMMIMGESELWVRNLRMVPNDELQNLGFKVALYPTSLLFAAGGEMRRTLQQLKEKGSTEGVMGQMMKFQEVTDLLGLPEIYEQEGKYRS